MILPGWLENRGFTERLERLRDDHRLSRDQPPDALPALEKLVKSKRVTRTGKPRTPDIRYRAESIPSGAK